MTKKFSKRTKIKTVIKALLYGIEVPIGRHFYVIRNGTLLCKEKSNEDFYPYPSVFIDDFLELVSNISHVNTALLCKLFKTKEYKKLPEKEVLSF